MNDRLGLLHLARPLVAVSVKVSLLQPSQRGMVDKKGGQRVGYELSSFKPLNWTAAIVRIGAISGPTGGPRTTHIHEFARKMMEAPPGFEPGMEVLQTSALPLGDGAVRKEPLPTER